MTGAVSRLGLAAVATAALLGAGAAPAGASGSLITVIDNSHADSWLEVDRAANVQNGSGTAGSDHDGSAVDVVEALAAAGRDEEDTPVRDTAHPTGQDRQPEVTGQGRQPDVTGRGVTGEDEQGATGQGEQGATGQGEED
ncbi:hypothetical protein [Streptomyces naphthomycinicus]|uniref:hypothetical protein n=1 Tax=Streptomyces naphthomycinicus TaxID=2872625 RepID=UPI001CECBF88|nr:hypothetical protein [Streptomyces sp. TML10]